MSETLPPPRADWQAKIAFARENGLQSASFHPDGSLESFILGPDDGGPPLAENGEERRAREAHRAGHVMRTLRGATSRLVPAGPIE